MTPLSKQRFLSLFVLFGILSAILIIVAQPVRADIIVNKDKYWNAGTLTLPSNGQGTLEHCTLESNTLKTPYNVVGFNVYTPPSYNSSNQSYPVIYLLHGINGNEFNYFSYFSNSTFFNNGSGSLPSYIDNSLADEAILVFVNGGARSFYNDWTDKTDEGPSSTFPILSESVIMNDVIPFIDANFRTVADRSGRALEGFSMGARGAIKLAFKFSDQFCSTIAYAGATYETIPNSAGPTFPYLGDYPESADMISNITDSNAASIKANGLQIRLVDGIGDGAAGQGGGNDDLDIQLNSLGIPHEFEPNLAGVTAHDWGQYHQVTGLYGLNFHFQCFAAAQSAAPAPIIQGTADVFSYLPMVIGSGTSVVSPGSCN